MLVKNEGAIRLMIVERAPLIRMGLRSVLELEQEITIVAELGNVTPMRLAVERHQPQVILLGLAQASSANLATISELDYLPNPPAVIVLVAKPNPEQMQLAFRAGAFGYFSHRVALNDLVIAIRQAAYGERDSISSRELEVLIHVTNGQCNKQIARTLRIGEQTIKNALTSTMRKLGARNRTQAVIYAMQRGWIPLYDTRG